MCVLLCAPMLDRRRGLSLYLEGKTFPPASQMTFMRFCEISKDRQEAPCLYLAGE
jgi:hypothetical protein